MGEHEPESRVKGTIALQPLNWLLYRAPLAAKLIGPAYAALMTGVFVYSGVLFANALPEHFSSRNELLGQSLLLIVAPAILLTYVVVAQRRSFRLATELFASGVVNEEPSDWLQARTGRFVPLGMIAGFLFGLIFNLRPEWRSSFGSIGSQLLSIAIGQLLLWTLSGFVLAIRFATALGLHEQGKTAPIDLYDRTKLEPFARNGLDDVLAITLLLALATLQSLDAQFRLDNYANAWLIALPAAAGLLMLPIWSLHRRLRSEKHARVREMNAKIATLPRDGANESLSQLELLMQHRDRLSHAPTWPIDFSIASRLVFYIFIPPLAWVGAALVELAIDRALTGS